MSKRARSQASPPGLQVEASSQKNASPNLQSEAPVQLQGFVTTDHFLTVPLDHFNDNKSDRTIRIFARQVVATTKVMSNLPYLCYLQGGPGFEGPIPSEGMTWLKAATKHFKVILLDQRGTGKSAPIRASTLKEVGDTDEQVMHLRHFRADSIVADAELLRVALNASVDKKRWCILGQSFGGFCCISYMSKAPEGLLEVFLTGGIPPKIDAPCAAEAVYNETFKRVIHQNDKYYTRFPNDIELVKDIVKFLVSQPEGGVRTPNGSWLRPRTLQLLGWSALGFGGAGGGFDRLHFMLSSALDYSGQEPELTPSFLKDFEGAMPFDTNPLYALLHESIYTQGPATNWAAERVRSSARYADTFDALACLGSDKRVLFTGEMVFPWMFDDLAGLRPFKEVAMEIATSDGWSKLYDSAKLASNKTPVAAACYCEDMYVDFNLSQETASMIPRMRQWMTNEFQHSGLRDDGAAIFESLLGMTRNSSVSF